MMITKAFTVFAAVFFAAGAFADALNVLVSFWSTNDYYEDGTQVLPGEWYALCWSPNAKFGGITCDFEPAVEGDMIFEMMPRAKRYSDGNVGCKFTVFQADSSKVKSGGNYFVYLLDTRNVEGTAVTTTTKVNSQGLTVPDVKLSGGSVSGSFSANAAFGKNNAVETDVAAEDVGTWTESALPADIKQPRIVDFKPIEDAKVYIKVADMVPGIKYNVKMGSDPANLTTYRLQAPKTSETESDTVEFEVSCENAYFFQVIRQPLGQKIVAEEE